MATRHLRENNRRMLQATLTVCYQRWHSARISLTISKLRLCVEMTFLNLVKYSFATIVLLYSSCAAWATADAETPEQELEVLRLILLEKDMHTVLAEMKKYGCIWNSEFIWFYASEKLSDATYRWGGELVIQGIQF